MGESDNTRSTVILRDFLANPQNQEAYERFFRKYHDRIFQTCRRLGLQEADAEEVTATVLLKFYEPGGFKTFVFRGKDSFNGWLFVSVRNATQTFRRNTGRVPGAQGLGHEGTQAVLEQVPEEVIRDLESVCAEDVEAAKAALERVRQRVDEITYRAFELQFFDGKSGAAVAAELGIKISSVYQAKSRIEKHLKEEFAMLGDTE